MSDRVGGHARLVSGHPPLPSLPSNDRVASDAPATPDDSGREHPGPDPADLPLELLADRGQAPPEHRQAAIDPRDARDGAGTRGFLPGADDEAPHPTGRVDALDGVRTLAVFLVVLFHIGMPGFSAGFLGVDVFFVLSGFLITTLLLRDIVAHGRIDLPRFWARRMARLMPAALILFIVVGIWSLSAAPAFRRPELGADTLWCLLYVGNWHFIATSSYFAFNGTTSPLLHLWSLGVEEQFYVVWPLILAAVALLLAGMSSGRHARRDVRGARRRSTTAVLLTGGVLAVASLVLMAQTYAVAGPDRAYMGTDTKVFEPLIGAVFAAAVLRRRVGRLVRRYAQELMVLGVGGILLGVALLGGETGPHPAYFVGGAVAVSLATVALVAGASYAATDRGLGRAFSQGGVTYLGRISYGIYLWHWPWAMWLLPGGQFEPSAALLVVAMTIATAATSYHLVELPLRTGRFRLVRPIRILRTGAAGMAVTSVVPLLLGGTPWYDGLRSAQAGLATAPATGEVAQAGPTPPSRVLLVGDSVPLQLYGAFAEYGETRGVRVINGAHGGCSASGLVTVNPDGTPYNPGIPRMPGAPAGPVCAGVPQDQKDLIASEKPDVVLWWSRYEYADLLGPDGKPVRARDPGYRALQASAFDAAVERLTAGGATLVVMQPEPTGMRTAERCTPDRRTEATGECAAFLVRLRYDDDVRRAWIDILRAKAAKDRRVRLVSIADLFCRNSANPCDDRLPLAVGGAFPPPAADAARPDGSHFAAAPRPTVATTALDRALRAAVREGP